jgi:hypothetical protein
MAYSTFRRIARAKAVDSIESSSNNRASFSP